VNWILIFLIVSLHWNVIRKINQTRKEIMATQQEQAEKLNVLANQIEKVLTEVVDGFQALKDALANADQTTPEVNSAMDRLASGIQRLDDLNPDKTVLNPSETPTPEPTP
jgi:ABC-type transporter Mla subunit MlaD